MRRADLVLAAILTLALLGACGGGDPAPGVGARSPMATEAVEEAAQDRGPASIDGPANAGRAGSAEGTDVPLDEGSIHCFQMLVDAHEEQRRALEAWSRLFQATQEVLRPPEAGPMPLDTPWHPEIPPNHPWFQATEAERQRAIAEAARLEAACEEARRTLDDARERVSYVRWHLDECTTWEPVRGQGEGDCQVDEGGTAAEPVRFLVFKDDCVQPGYRYMVVREGTYVSAIEVTAIEAADPRLRALLGEEDLRRATARVVPSLHARDILFGDDLVPR